MSSFAITSGHYLRAAVLAYESSSQQGFFEVMHATGSLDREAAWEAWSLFKSLFLPVDRLQFESRDHCVTALLMMFAICLDEESEEEGQL